MLRFRRALLTAWQEALAPANAEKTIDTVHTFDQNTPRAIIEKQLKATRELMLLKGELFGKIDVAAWQQTEKIMLEQGLIAAPVSVERALLTDHGLPTPVPAATLQK